MPASDPQSPTPGVDPDNPYNIDYEREKRLIRIFWIFIGSAFLIAALAVALALVLDAVTYEEPPAPPSLPSTPTSTSDAGTYGHETQHAETALANIGKGVFT